ncbi:uncharacterized protein LOC127422111 [Myxocyprinus asiaticus]|uniref:uncharacterized protein LOC127422111 n=1 Tax=Myxocyprinus asiaticus TaxID=70543 RepID=UPI0022233AA5|nr:uncharacterized protein LOC127422111 [Myxocyprinus asiaticus]
MTRNLTQTVPLNMTNNLTQMGPLNMTNHMSLETISKDNCKRDRACFSTPPTCNPAAQGSCFFVSTRAVYGNANNLTFELSGESNGYIAVGLSRDNREGDGDTVYSCANNNGIVKFTRATLNNSRLTQDNAFNPRSFRGSVNRSKIQCTFIAPGLSNRSVLAAYTGAFLFFFTGNFTNGSLQSPITLLVTNRSVDLSNPNSTDTAVIKFNTNTSAASNATTRSNTTASWNGTAASNATTSTSEGSLYNSTTNETISRDNCRRDRACFSTPPTCNPAAQGSCFFVSTRAVYGNANNLTFELSGESNGYIAVGLSRDNREGDGDTVYSCANNNGIVKFTRATLNNSRLTQDNAFIPRSFRGSVNRSKIQCTFIAPGLSNSSAPAAYTGAFLFFFTGNFTNGSLQSPITLLVTNRSVDLSNPNSTDTAVIKFNTNTSAASNATTRSNTTASWNGTAASNATTSTSEGSLYNSTTNETISRDNCRRDRACFSTPPTCNPAAQGSCFFVSTRAVYGNANNLTFELSGESNGYIAVGLSRDNREGDGDTVYSCANNNGIVKFTRATLNNSRLTQDNAFIPRSFRGSVNRSKIQCTFIAPGLSNSSAPAAYTGAFLFFFTGNFTNGSLQSPITLLVTNRSVDLSNPNSTDTAVIKFNTNTSAASNATTRSNTTASWNGTAASNATTSTSEGSLYNSTTNETISRDNCRRDRACFSTPPTCNPAAQGSCFFVSTRAVYGNANNLTFELSGESNGYIAVGLSRDNREGDGDTVYSCANNNGIVKFTRATLNNSRLTQDNAFIPRSFRGSVNRSKIQCTFIAPGLSNSSAPAAYTGAFLFFFTGNFTNGSLQSPITLLVTNRSVDLSNPNSTDTAVIKFNTNTSAASNATTRSNTTASWNGTAASNATTSTSEGSLYNSTTNETISRDNCRRDRACFSTPPTCNPAAQGSCFFVSTRAVYGNANNLTFELSGESNGYIAVGLSRDNREGDGDTVYSCANNNGIVKFTRATLNNSRLTQDNAFIPRSFRGSVNRSKIQCTFIAPGLSNSSAPAAYTGAFLFFFTGNFTNGSLQSPITLLVTNRSVDLSNPNSTDTAVIKFNTNTSAASNATTRSNTTASWNGTAASNATTSTSEGSLYNSTTNETISRDNCRRDRACFSTPPTCNPAAQGSCFFVSTRAVYGNANNLTFELSGESNGYIAVGLSRDNREGDGDTVYSCANNNGIVKFTRATLNNSRLTQDNAFIPRSFRGSVNRSKIQCTFIAPGLSNSSAPAAYTGAFLFFFTGNFTNGSLQSPITLLVTNRSVDLSNPNSTDTAVIKFNTNTSAASNATTRSNTTASWNGTAASNATTSTSEGSLYNSTTNETISRDNCRRDRACFSTPPTCNPAAQGSCFFVSTRAVYGNANNLTFELSGESNGYIAVGLSRDNREGDGDTVYSCSNNNGIVKFYRATLNNNRLTQDNSFMPRSVHGSVNGRKIQCIFIASGLSNSIAPAASTGAFLFFFTGSFTNGSLESPITRLFTSGSVDLSNPNSHLNFAMCIIPQGRSFISHLLTLAHSIDNLSYISIDDGCHSDLLFWSQLQY